MKDYNKIRQLNDHYSELIRLETEEFGIKPTEVRHPIGRLGEFYCALETNGQLAHTANQHGFDVISENGRKISVKTTAQTSGFVAISARTINKADDLKILQYLNGEINVVYYGAISIAISDARLYEKSGNYELDIAPASVLGHTDVLFYQNNQMLMQKTILLD